MNPTHLVKTINITDHIGGNFVGLTVLECEYPTSGGAASPGVGESPVSSSSGAPAASAGAGNAPEQISGIVTTPVQTVTLPDVVKTRDGQDLRLLASQKKILNKVVRPFIDSSYQITGLVRKDLAEDKTAEYKVSYAASRASEYGFVFSQGLLLRSRVIQYKPGDIKPEKELAPVAAPAFGGAAARLVGAGGEGAGGAGEGAGGAGGAGNTTTPYVVMRSSMVRRSQTYPIQRTLNMPPGTGKTVVSSVGVLTHMMLPGAVERMKRAFADAQRFESLTSTGARVVSDALGPVKRVLLPNAVLVHCPKQLVGAWRDTLAANATELSATNGGRIIHVLPKNKGLTMAAEFDPSPVLANPDEIFVFVVHDANLDRFLVAARPTPEHVPHPTKAGETLARFSELDLLDGLPHNLPGLPLQAMPVMRMDMTIYHYGAMVVDEADRFDYNILNLYNRAQPPAMYNLLVTATPNNLPHKENLGGLLSVFHPAPWFAHRSRECPHGSWDFMRRDYLPVRGVGALAPHAAVQATELFDHLARVMSSNVMSIRDLRGLVQEVSALIEPMHSYVFACRRSIQQQLGMVEHDMGDHEDLVKRVEKSFELTLHGSTLDKVLVSLGRKVEQCLAQIKTKGGLTAAAANAAVAEGGDAALAGFERDVRELLMKLKRMRLFERVLADCAEETCGVCWEPIGKPSDIQFTTCCAFCVCKDCHKQLVENRSCCPKCRFAKTRFGRVEEVDSEDDEAGAGAGAGAGASSSRGRGYKRGIGAAVGAGAGAGAGDDDDDEAAAPARKRRGGGAGGAGGRRSPPVGRGGPPGSSAAVALAAELDAAAHAAKNPAAFEAYLQTGFQAANMSQSEAVAALLRKAGECGMTHVILAGPNVSCWSMVRGVLDRNDEPRAGDADAVQVEGYRVIRPSGSGKPRSALNLDRMYASYAVGSLDPTQKCMLVLDTVTNGSTELTGIDAKKTDLIIQVTEVGAREAEYKQLMGRAQRLGRRGYAVHVLLN